MRKLRDCYRAGALIGAAAIFGLSADRLLAAVDDDDECCFSQICGQQIATDCIGGCFPHQVCTGDGGCTPFPWAEAECKADPFDPAPDPAPL